MTSCRWVANNQPRIIPDRHNPDCPGNNCPGCQPCTQPHCRICRHTHVAQQTCTECLAETRDTLHDIARMCHALPTEATHRGIEGEALMLLGPTADLEAWQHVEASYLAGRLPEGWFETSHGKGCPTLRNEPCLGCAGGELHPLTILGTWEMVWRDFLAHESDAKITVAAAVRYLDTQMTYMAQQGEVPFEDFARDLRRCRTHLEAVLHDGEQVDSGAPCMSCNVPLERTWGSDAKDDGWRCPRCRQTSTEDQYRFAIAHLHRDSAAWLTDRDMEIRTGVKAGTVRVWAQRGDVERRRDQGRTVYAVADVEQRMRRSA